MGEFNKIEESELPDSVAQAFLGTLCCARCTLPPLERYTQDDFYHFAACFAKVNLDRQNPQSGSSAVITTSRDEREQYKRIAEAATRWPKHVKQTCLRNKKTKQIADRQRELDEQQRRLAEIRQREPGVNQPRTGKFYEAQTLDRVALAFDKDSDPRSAFVNWAIQASIFQARWSIACGSIFCGRIG